MQNVSQKEAADAMPLAKVESARFWRDSRFRDMECLSASFLTHEYAPHAHDTFSIGAIESGSQIATVYALRKDPEKVFEWLEHGWTTHDGGVIEMRYNPFLLTYKDDPRFIAFAQKIGVMPKTAPKL